MIARFAAKVETAPALPAQRRGAHPVRRINAWSYSEPAHGHAPQRHSLQGPPLESPPLSTWAHVRPRSTRLVFGRSRACLAMV